MQKYNAPHPQFLKQFNSGGIYERHVRQVEGQADSIPQTVQIAGFPKFFNAAIRHAAFHPKPYGLA
jgi:hypothetical protein